MPKPAPAWLKPGAEVVVYEPGVHVNTDNRATRMVVARVGKIFFWLEGDDKTKYNIDRMRPAGDPFHRTSVVQADSREGRWALAHHRRVVMTPSRSNGFTALRLAMLRKIGNGEVYRGLSVAGWDIRGECPAARVACYRAVDWLVRERYAVLSQDNNRRVELTDAGGAVLGDSGQSALDEIEIAIRLLRERAAAATPDPWAQPYHEDAIPGEEGWWIHNGEHGSGEHGVCFVPDFNPRATADTSLIAMMASPALANALADLLDAQLAVSRALQPMSLYATEKALELWLVVARAVRRVPPPAGDAGPAGGGT